MEKTMVTQSDPLQSMDDHNGAGIQLQPMENLMSQAVEIPGRKLQLVENWTWRRLLTETLVPGEEPR
ncbi:hypothetical protein AV530_013855 [Patagioenas fasciata monilis]|uniref:Uncharacterized protein n=1 Tax=Patagioenas fasciata monilis TaxID=372326 RepID=A0A1V4L192_PATFA|nr:hypothetical protein AV530_013855 [Patagioenas fasciata monilis]